MSIGIPMILSLYINNLILRCQMKNLSQRQPIGQVHLHPITCQSRITVKSHYLLLCITCILFNINFQIFQKKSTGLQLGGSFNIVYISFVLEYWDSFGYQLLIRYRSGKVDQFKKSHHWVQQDVYPSTKRLFGIRSNPSRFLVFKYFIEFLTDSGYMKNLFSTDTFIYHCKQFLPPSKISELI